MNGDTFKFTMIGDDQLTRPLKQAQEQTRRLGNEISKTNKQMSAFGSNLVNTRRGIRGFAMGGLQQAGYQIGDYAVQVANGTSKMQAFGQQAPQFLQIFGPIGSAVGAVVAILAAYGVAAEKTAEASEKASGKMKTFAEAADLARTKYKEAASAMRIASETDIQEARKIYSDFDGDLKGFLTTLAALRKEQAAASGVVAAQKFFEEAVTLQSLRKEYEAFTAARQFYIDGLAEEQKTRAESIAFYKQEISALEKSIELQKQTSGGFIDPNVLRQLQELQQELDAIRTNSITPFVNKLSIPEDVMISILNYEDAIKKAIKEQNFDAAITSVGRLRNEFAKLPDETQKKIRPALVAFEGYLREVGLQMDIVNGKVDDLGAKAERAHDRIKVLLDRVRAEDQVIFDPRDPRYNEIAVIMAQIREEYGKTDNKIKSTTKSAGALTKTIQTQLTPEMKRLRDFGDAVGQSFENSMMGMIDGTMKAKDAFRVMAADIIKELYRIFVVKRITGFITDMFGMASLPSNKSHTGSFGLPNFDFNGGGYTGNGARAGGIDGKGGFMAMLHPRETVVDHTKGQGAGVTVVQNINVSTGVQQTVRTEIKSLMPQIAESAKSAVMDAKRRGGSYGRSFA